MRAGTAGDLGLHTPLVASSAFVRRYDPAGSVEVNPGEDGLGLCKKTNVENGEESTTEKTFPFCLSLPTCLKHLPSPIWTDTQSAISSMTTPASGAISPLSRASASSRSRTKRNFS